MILNPKQKTHMARKMAWRIALQNLSLMLALFITSVFLLNAFLFLYVHAGIDNRMSSELAGFVEAQQNPDKRSIRPPKGLIPVIYYTDENGVDINPFPASYATPDDYENILRENIAEGFSTHNIGGRTYRVYRVDYDPTLTFLYDDTESSVRRTVSFFDMSSEQHMLDTIGVASFLVCAIGGVFYGMLAFISAKRIIEPIEKTWANQRMLLADTSHELRNPIAAIKASAELLLREPDRTVMDAAEEVSGIIEDADHMAAILSSLLTLARADAENNEIARERIDLSAALESACRRFDHIATPFEVSIDVDIEQELVVRGDKARLQEMFDVLLDNAIRYNVQGGHVHVCAFKGRKKIVVRIADTGIGIEADELERVFERFHRTRRSREINPEGTGLGLPVAQWIAQCHNAVFSIESEEGAGTLVEMKFDEYEA